MDVFPVAQVAQPVVVQDVSHAETVQSIAAALKTLATTTDAVFSRIEQRATLERKRVQQLQDRISAVQNRIKQMTGSNKAITIFARTQYPAAEVAKFGTYTTLLDGMDYPALNEPLDSELAPPDASPLVMSQLSPDDEVLKRGDKRRQVQQLLARVSWQGTNKHTSGPAPAGLGRLPATITSVQSTLLFNSKENPYKIYNTISDLISEETEEIAAAALRREAALAREKLMQKRLEEEAKRLGVAPTSLVEGDNLPAIAQVEYIYKPKMRELDTISFASNLALPNIASISWSASLQSIAPSVIKAGEQQLPTDLHFLPDVAATLPPVAAPPGAVPPPPSSTVVAPPPSSSVTVVAPPPAPSNTPAVAPPPAVAPSTTAMPPPVAVPSAPQPSSASAAPGGDAESKPPQDVPAPAPERINLLAALANPENILKLRKTEKAKEEGSKPAAKASASAGPMDIMAQMRMKLEAKRQGQSGNILPPKSTTSAATPASEGGHLRSFTTSTLPSLSEDPPIPSAGAGHRPYASEIPAKQAEATSSGFRALLSATSMKTTRKRKDSDDWDSDSDDSD